MESIDVVLEAKEVDFEEVLSEFEAAYSDWPWDKTANGVVDTVASAIDEERCNRPLGNRCPISREEAKAIVRRRYPHLG